MTRKDGTTWWFETESDEALSTPPDLSARTDIQAWDIFYHKYPGRFQLWVLVTDSSNSLRWKLVNLGYARTDGKRLTLTEQRKQPSWVSESWYVKSLKKKERKSQK